MSKEAAASPGAPAGTPDQAPPEPERIPKAPPKDPMAGAAGTPLPVPPKEEQELVLKTGELPGGMVIDGQLVRNITFRECDGDTRVLLGDPTLRKDFVKLLDTYLEKCIVDIGGNKPTKHLIQSMLVGDRDYCALKIYSITFGGENGVPPRTEFRCPSCTEKCSAEVKVTEFGVYPLDDNMDNLVTVGVPPQERQARVFKVELPQYKLVLGFRYADGYDQSAVAALGFANPVHAEHAMIIRTCVHWEQDGVVAQQPLGTDLLGKLSAAAIYDLEGEYLANACGLETSHEYNCWKCGAPTEVTFNVADFIAKAPKQRKRSKKKFS